MSSWKSRRAAAKKARALEIAEGRAKARGIRDFLDSRLAAEYEAASGHPVEFAQGRFFWLSPCPKGSTKPKRHYIATRSGMPFAIIKAYATGEATKMEDENACIP